MYTYTWRKYLPLIRLLLKKSATSSQAVMLNQTDFLKFSKSRKPALTFSIDIREGKYSVLKLPVIAAELLEILLEDPACRTLIRSGLYNLTLAKNYQLIITNLAAVDAIAENGEATADASDSTSDSSAEAVTADSAELAEAGDDSTAENTEEPNPEELKEA